MGLVFFVYYAKLSTFSQVMNNFINKKLSPGQGKTVRFLFATTYSGVKVVYTTTYSVCQNVWL